MKKSTTPMTINYLRFLWFDDNEKVIVYRHRRVVFGLNCSPFLLGATIEHHLSKKSEECELDISPYSRNTVVKLSKSFYVDNCVTSVANNEVLEQFVRE
ncbi:hypothetical protein NQ315_014599 [Exocentrus adspersus]|uniref:Uncharacterized protein n=1 Tax=Exocentrus adspersus TaxID=1586481 RepID=A0AAV8VQB8_9CUCU|nr:hypothetical protein NQ315_014599 [Exocentrus adspersus]